MKLKDVIQSHLLISMGILQAELTLNTALFAYSVDLIMTLASHITESKITGRPILAQGWLESVAPTNQEAGARKKCLWVGSIT